VICLLPLQCIDTVSWVTGRTSGLLQQSMPVSFGGFLGSRPSAVSTGFFGGFWDNQPNRMISEKWATHTHTHTCSILKWAS